MSRPCGTASLPENTAFRKSAKKVGYCIADSLGKGHLGNLDEGLYFSGANGYRVDKIISVKELIDELTQR